MPALLFAALPIYDVYLMRQTERQLLAQSVVIAEAFRVAWLTAQELPTDMPAEVRSIGDRADRYVAIEPVIDLGVKILSAQGLSRPGGVKDPLMHIAGATLTPLLQRAQVFNLSAVQVLDPEGCVAATTGTLQNTCLGDEPEVARAMSGTYHAVVRERVTDHPTPPLNDIRRRGQARIFIALPVFHNDGLIGIVRASRTSVSGLESLWENRRGLVLVIGGSVAASVLLTLFIGWLIASPLWRLTKRTQELGSDTNPAPDPRWLPHELRQLETTLLKMAHDISTKARYAAAYAGNVSHELRAPITSIQGASELLLHEWQQMSDAQRNRFLSNIHSDALRMAKTVSDLLYLANVENSDQNSGQSVVALSGFAADLGALFGDRLKTKVTPPDLTVTIQPQWLQSATGNLVSNALQWSDGVVEVTFAKVGDLLQIEVIDSGPGINPDKQALVFERFFTERRNTGGTGLGLPIALAIAQARGGTITLQSRPGRTAFTLTL